MNDFIYKMLYVGDGRKNLEMKNSPFGCSPIPLLRYGGRLFSGVRERWKQAGPTLSGRGGSDLMGKKRKSRVGRGEGR